MGLEEANRQICDRMLEIVRARQEYCDRSDKVGSEAWRRGIVRRRLIRQALQAALQPTRN